MGLWALCLSFCSAYSTDGRVGKEDVAGLAGRRSATLAARLVAAGLWIEDGPNAWIFHDFREYNPTAAQMDAERQRKIEAGRVGGLAKAAGASRRLAGASSVLPESAVARPVPSRPDPSDPDPPPVAPQGAPTPKRARKAPAGPRPEGWEPDPSVYAAGARVGLDPRAVDRELQRFADFHASKGSIFVNWQAAARTWLWNVARFAPKGSAPASPLGTKARAPTRAEVEAMERAPWGMSPAADPSPPPPRPPSAREQQNQARIAAELRGEQPASNGVGEHVDVVGLLGGLFAPR